MSDNKDLAAVSFAYYDNMTDKQRAVTNKLTARVENDLLNYLRDAREAYDAIEKLPATNEHGKAVVHGCNVRMSNTVAHYMAMVHKNYLVLRMIDDKRATEIWLANTDLFKY